MNSALKKILESDLDEYKSIPFWSWNNTLDEKELVKQIVDMKNAGIGGFIMHARLGMRDEYLGEKWFSCIDACLKKARELHMQAWVYDENGWPSGFVGGKLLENEEYRCRFLEYRVGAFDEEAFAVFVGNGDDFVRTEQEIAGVAEYHNIYIRVSPANTDILNPDVVDAFIRETHQKYYERFADSFGKELAGFFTDEPQYYRWATPYSASAEAILAQKGIDVKDGLIWLFQKGEGGTAFRSAYYGALHQLYNENFYKKIYLWCQEHNCKLTGHSIDETTLSGQVLCSGAVMPTYENEHIPAIDWLGRKCGFETAPKQVGSVASQLGKKHVLTETFACSGYDVTPRELKSIGDFQYFNGVNMMCHHLYPYSIAGQGKMDHPPVFSPHGNWFKEFRIFNDYFTKLGYIIANTKEVHDVAVLHPIRSVWLDYVFRFSGETTAAAQTGFNNLLLFLRKNGITYHFIDEALLAQKGAIEGEALRLGEETYKTVLIPPMKSLQKTTYELLRQYKGKLFVSGEISYLDGEKAEVALTSNTTLEEVAREKAFPFVTEDESFSMTAREGEIGKFVFLKNLSYEKLATAVLEGISKRYMALDLETLTTSPIEDTVTLRSSEGMILVEDEEAALSHVGPTEEKDITDAFRLTSISENYLMLDRASMSKDGVSFSEPFAVQGLMDGLLRENYKGDIFIRHTFTVKDKMPLLLQMEKADFTLLTLNGKKIELHQSDYDCQYVEAEIAPEDLNEGENELLYSFYFWQHEGVHFALFDPLATESLRNCLYYDTSIEPLYLKGSFALDESFAIQKPKALPPVCDTLYQEGYPFFKGEIALDGTVSWDGKGSVALALDGRFLVSSLLVNGKETAFVLSDTKDITPLLQKGDNKVRLVVKSSLRNLYGPHHYKPIAEPIHVSPYQFAYRTLWKDGLPRDYTEEYQFVPFGISRIRLLAQH
ncbi:MAG: hypothetical protein J6K61_07090 [Clostridia bacterium]|nr:hypothetical protein [Clostridia bacterium]